MNIHLHCKSYFSFLDGASSVEALVSRAAASGVRHLALTDRWGVYAAVDFCRQAEAAGVHPVVGAEIPVEGGHRAVVLCRDRPGYAQLCRELTLLHLASLDPGAPGEKPPRGAGEGASAGVIDFGESLAKSDTPFTPRSTTVAPRPSSFAPRPSPVETSPAGLLALERLAERDWVLVDSPVLLEAMARRTGPVGLAAELVDHGRPDDRTRNRMLLETARRLGVTVVAANDVMFATPDDFETHRLLTAIRRRSTLGKLGEGDTASPEAWLKPPSAMARLFAEVPEALTGAAAVAESCQFCFDTGRTLHPPFPLPEGETAFSLLWQRAFAGIARRRRPLTPEVIQRLEHELDIIRRTGYAEYFLIVGDIVAFAESNGIPTVGRGSAAGSLTAYALGVTHVDPIALNLSFERFLNPQRTDPPDIDLDFCWRRRGEVIRYLYDTYGRENTAMLCTYVTMAGRGALRETARALGMAEADISRFTRHIPHHDARHIETVLREIPECRNIPFHLEPYRTVIRLAKNIAGFPRHLGLHPCGIVLSRTPLHQVVPLQLTASGLPATQFDMREAEDVGLLKIDILGQRSLSVIADAAAAVQARVGAAVDFASTRGDPATWRMIQGGRTMGCFQIESPGMRSLLKKLAPRDMETIIAASSVIRPGPSDAGMLREFIARYHARKPVIHLHPELASVLGTTLGIMVYQEDILRVAETIAGITPDEADKLRRAMSSKRSAEAMAALRDTFLEKATARGVVATAARRIWRQMETFSGYAFCKAHSASYAELSWQAAWLKAHHPAEFFAAVLSNGGGFYNPAAYVLEARRWGVPVRLPHLNRSERACTADGGDVRLGLGMVGRLAQASIDRILTARREGAFTSFTDFLQRTTVSREETDALIRCGALDCFEFSRPELLWRLELLFEPVRRKGRAARTEKELPFERVGEWVFPASIVPRVPDFTLEEKLQQEAEVLGMYVSDHPLVLHHEELAKIERVRAADIPRCSGRIVRLAGWLVTTRRVFAKNKQYMKFLTLEDESDIYEVVMFPDAYARWGQFTAAGGAFVVEGKVSEEFGSFSIEANRVLPLGKFVEALAGSKSR